MSRSKRNRVVPLSHLSKKGRKLSNKTHANAIAYATKYPYVYVVSVDNMRNTYLKDVRRDLSSDSKLLFGRSKVMAIALGTQPENSPVPSMHLLSPYIKGPIGLLFTTRAPAAIKSYFATFRRADYPRAGTSASAPFALPAGTVCASGGALPPDNDVPLPHTMEPLLRKNGLSTRLERGRVLLDREHVVCRQGEVLDAAQTALLKAFGVRMAEFAVEVKAYWTKAGEEDGGEVVVLQEGDKEMVIRTEGPPGIQQRVVKTIRDAESGGEGVGRENMEVDQMEEDKEKETEERKG